MSEVGHYEDLVSFLENLEGDKLVHAVNDLRKAISVYSPFKDEPVDCVQWVKLDDVRANDYNPNSVAPPEMELLRTSIMNDGYTQPVVTWPTDDTNEVIDGFHRNRVARECEDVANRIHGYLPIVSIKDSQKDRNDRIASTIRHNRARGKHKIESMSDIVIELKKRNWTDKRIAKELGMDEDEILRLCQVSGLTDLFDDSGFSQSWDIGIFDEGELMLETEDVEPVDGGRVYHTWDKWECFDHNFYGSRPPKGMTKEDCEEMYRALLADPVLFGGVLAEIIVSWKHSCEHYLTNDKMNRIAWLGQAALAMHDGIPACFRGGYNLLSESEQEAADAVALEYLNKWLVANDREPLTMDSCKSKTEANIY